MGGGARGEKAAAEERRRKRAHLPAYYRGEPPPKYRFSYRRCERQYRGRPPSCRVCVNLPIMECNKGNCLLARTRGGGGVEGWMEGRQRHSAPLAAK